MSAEANCDACERLAVLFEVEPGFWLCSICEEDRAGAHGRSYDRRADPDFADYAFENEGDR